MLRATLAIILVTAAVAVDWLAAAYLPGGYARGLSVLGPLTAFAAVAWAFVPSRNRTRS
jgi:hypothetical protein